MLNCLLTVCVPFEKSAAHKNGFEVLVHIYYLPVETCALRRNSHGPTKQSDTAQGAVTSQVRHRGQVVARCIHQHCHCLLHHNTGYHSHYNYSYNSMR